MCLRYGHRRKNHSPKRHRSIFLDSKQDFDFLPNKKAIETFTDDELIDVLKKAELYDFVEALPNGMDTPVSEQGANLSQGQLQRLAIARAIVKRAPIMIFDDIIGE